ncbi:MAG: YhcB family protein [Gammaproteobacteria bacterium]|nr:YhcB family protein [Gammaproteobacteria bacterium]
METTTYSIEIIIGAAALLALLALGIGIAIGRSTSASGQKYREVERKLDHVLQDKKRYEDEVVEHFEETAQLLNALTESYRDVHNHLAKGAAGLCLGQGPVSLEQLSNEGDSAQIPSRLAPVHPPLDYAPKTSPDEKGMLNEEFGLERPIGPDSANPAPKA